VIPVTTPIARFGERPEARPPVTPNASIRRASACSEVAGASPAEINFCCLQRRQWRLRLPTDAASTTGCMSLNGHRPSTFDRSISSAV
jgi:hypothetical protein